MVQNIQKSPQIDGFGDIEEILQELQFYPYHVRVQARLVFIQC